MAISRIPLNKNDMVIDNLPSATETVSCPDCDGVYTLRGMHAHRRGLRCRVDTQKKGFRARGKLALQRSYEGTLLGCKIPFERGYVSYKPGGPGKESEAVMGCWIDKDVHAYLWLVDDVWSKDVVSAQIRRLLWALWGDAGFRRAFLVLIVTVTEQAVTSSVDVEAAIHDLLIEWRPEADEQDVGRADGGDR